MCENKGLVCAMTVSKLAVELRALTDAAKRRVWIASPYIGSWRAVRRILGLAWQKVDARLLIDKDSGILARDTIEEFAKHWPIHSLMGLHAKLYVVDDSVLLTSANLTECAFTRRYEAGLVLKGPQAQALIELYECLWKLANEVPLHEIHFTKRKNGFVDEVDGGAVLPKLYDLPPGPAPSPSTSLKSAGDFADYPYFLEEYQRFANDYMSCGEREWPEQPLYLETDKFLNFLFHHAEGTPSKKYKTKRYLVRSDSDILDTIKTYREQWRRTRQPDGDLPGGDHTTQATTVQVLLHASRVKQLTDAEVKEVAESLNCFGNHRTLSRFLKGNNLDTIRTCWHDLVHGQGDVKFRMNKCASALYGFGPSATHEILGYYGPKTFPLRNANTNAGLRFLGYNVKN
jgi:hypothetical protein